ncbi:MAG: serine/threonine transporter SstT [Oscillospiraceae bacterium]|nr:serine/threonine transporter SstT [Oscillospiraceae bacterium]
MKNFVQKWNSYPLVARIAGGLLIGVLLGVFCPQLTVVSVLGNVFVGALKGIAPVLVFVLIVSSLANVTNTLGRQFRTVILLYMGSTLLASLLAVCVSFLFPVTLVLTDAASNEAPSGIWEVLGALITNMVQNPISSILNANYIGILSWAIIFGLALKKIASPETKTMLTDISDAISCMVRWIISCAPFGILGLVFGAVSSSGLSIFVDYGKLLVVLVGCMLTVALVINPLIIFLLLHKNPYPLVFKCLRESGITAFFTRSSAANIPVNMQLCERLGLNKDVYSISIPLGATINMDGAAITIAVMSLAAANTVGVEVDLATGFVLSVLATLAACGASGVAGGSLLLIPMACSLFGVSNDIAMQVVAVGFIIGVIQDSVETALNSAGDVEFAATAEYYEWKKAGREVSFDWDK